MFNGKDKHALALSQYVHLYLLFMCEQSVLRNVGIAVRQGSIPKISVSGSLEGRERGQLLTLVLLLQWYSSEGTALLFTAGTVLYRVTIDGQGSCLGTSFYSPMQKIASPKRPLKKKVRQVTAFMNTV